DAIGEAYDKTAKWLGLNLKRSGGPAIDELAKEENAKSLSFLVPMKQHKDCNFSYAGLKTQGWQSNPKRCTDAKIPISSASFVHYVMQDLSSVSGLDNDLRITVLHLEERCERTIQWALKMKPFIRHLLVCPPPRLCTDNGNNIVFELLLVVSSQSSQESKLVTDSFNCDSFQYDLRSRWSLGEEYADGRSEPRSIKGLVFIHLLPRKGIRYLQRLNASNVSTSMLEKGDFHYKLYKKGELMRALGGAIACPSLLGVPLGHNSSFLQRPAFAPPRIREAIWCGSTNSSTEGGKELEDPQVLTDVGDVPIREIRDCGVNDDRLMNVINESVKLVMEEAPLRPLVLDGNHSISYPVVRAVSEKLGGPVDILYLDAHLDIYHCFEGN
ncbi:hypothetical protein S83_063439, partial [Arachis hypogaea]